MGLRWSTTSEGTLDQGEEGGRNNKRIHEARHFSQNLPEKLVAKNTHYIV